MSADLGDRSSYASIPAAITVALILVTIFSLTLAMFDRQLAAVEEKIDVQNAFLQGRAHYLPGASCVIATTAEQTSEDIVNFARACAKAHDNWLAEGGADVIR